MQAPRAEGRPLGEKEFSGAACGKWAQDCDTPTPTPASGAPPRCLLRVRPRLPREGILPDPGVTFHRAAARQAPLPSPRRLRDRGMGPRTLWKHSPSRSDPGKSQHWPLPTPGRCSRDPAHPALSIQALSPRVTRPHRPTQHPRPLVCEELWTQGSAESVEHGRSCPGPACALLRGFMRRR